MHWLLVAALAAPLPFSSPAGAAPDRPPVLVKRSGHELLTAPDRHVRALGHDLQLLLARGMAKSTTFAKLMSALDRLDIIVYVEFSQKLDSGVAGRLLFATSPANGPRYLRIQIAPEGTMNRQVAVIAHELQHALEVGLAPDVRDEAGFARLYERIGRNLKIAGCYDTEEAQLVGRRVLLEIEG